jgi:Bacterial archaeo-eukaryotic release factor family 3
MEKIHKAALKQLLKKQPGVAVTIYVPMHITASPPHINENQIRFKNLAHKAIEDLKARRNYDLAISLENQVLAAHDDLAFWKEQTPGMLVCATDERMDMFHLPVNTEEYVSIDTHFHLAPLLGLLSDEREYFVLELDEHNPHLLKGDMYGLEPSDVYLPANVKEATGLEHNGHQINHELSHSAGYPNRFFKIIDKIIFDKADHSLPLILSGTEKEIAMFRDLSKYPKILKGSIPSNFNKSEPRAMFVKAEAIIRNELILPEHQSAVMEYEKLEQSNPDKIASEEKELFEAAEQGRIDKLYTSMQVETADNVQDSSLPTIRITFFEPRLNSMLSSMAVKVWQMKGKVLNLLPNEMPNREPVLAKLRY